VRRDGDGELRRDTRRAARGADPDLAARFRAVQRQGRYDETSSAKVTSRTSRIARDVPASHDVTDVNVSRVDACSPGLAISACRSVRQRLPTHRSQI
jgi:hypothetical protein